MKKAKKPMSLEHLHSQCIEEGDCWIWQGCYNNKGYPMTNYNGEHILTRRLAITLDARPPAKRQPVINKCRDTRCINPAHLELSTHRQLGKRAAKEGKLATLHHRAVCALARRTKQKCKINMEIAQAIRASTEPGPVLAARYGIDRALVQRIRRNEAWVDFSNPFSGLMK